MHTITLCCVVCGITSSLVVIRNIHIRPWLLVLIASARCLLVGQMRKQQCMAASDINLVEQLQIAKLDRRE